jgi:hypothetical protein
MNFAVGDINQRHRHAPSDGASFRNDTDVNVKGLIVIPRRAPASGGISPSTATSQTAGEDSTGNGFTEKPRRQEIPLVALGAPDGMTFNGSANSCLTLSKAKKVALSGFSSLNTSVPARPIRRY